MELSANVGSIAGLLGAGGSAVAALGFSIVPQGGQLGPAGLNFADYENMKQFQGGICVNTYLNPEEKKLLNEASVSGTQGDWSLKLDYKFTSPKGEPKGCLAVAWNNKTWSDGYWKGEIRYEWLFTMGPESLISYGFYNTDNDSSGVKWKTTYVNREKNKNDALLWEGSEKPKKPKFSDAYAPDFDQICTTVKCIGNPEEESSGEVKWTWEDSSGKRDKFSDWTTNFDNAFSSLNTRLLLNSKTSQFFNQLIERKGIWTRR